MLLLQFSCSPIASFATAPYNRSSHPPLSKDRDYWGPNHPQTMQNPYVVPDLSLQSLKKQRSDQSLYLDSFHNRASSRSPADALAIHTGAGERADLPFPQDRSMSSPTTPVPMQRRLVSRPRPMSMSSVYSMPEYRQPCSPTIPMSPYSFTDDMISPRLQPSYGHSKPIPMSQTASKSVSPYHGYSHSSQSSGLTLTPSPSGAQHLTRVSTPSNEKLRSRPGSRSPPAGTAPKPEPKSTDTSRISILSLICSEALDDYAEPEQP
ncbi:uncharacterized protein BJ171DRAFT_582800 [Polychytrium aggregatum]|uniref:uncharacterized protein n=1 Tax=Polychytrium aggregatum TaxID=110093 RepID=UPI0022FDD02F|nr:uncharacterized protein BJ171DRAFT_582800 [Polychytrium aggregatum]KAI9203655.1 hypothetical protein BJ171DRAFT_582800 [Polychytrium aggregatum]